ncbi:MAG: serine/threonine protein kinase [Blautia sp.]|nr:serine/threonine protein kinase [Blautia sp.]
MDMNMPVSPWPEWEIISKIGEGSYGCVYKAARSEQGNTFYSAIKVISVPGSREELNTVLSEAGDENSARQYFENMMKDCIREISTMEYFRGNSYIVSVEDYKVTEYLDEIGWDIFIRMEYLQSFYDHFEERECTEDAVLKLGTDICRALGYLDQMQIIHRDIKPENIFVSPFGDYKLGDFGIAKENLRTLGTFSQKGTYTYMAPEVYHGGRYDSRADIYSLGIVLYKMLNNNRVPFVSPDKQLITHYDKEKALEKRMQGEVLPPPAAASSEMASIVLKACAFDTNDRYQNAKDMLHDLELLAAGRRSESCYSWEKKDKEKEQEPLDRGAIPAEQQVNTGGAEQTETKHGFRRFLPWAIAVIAVAAIVSIAVGTYIRSTLVNTVREQTAQMLVSLQSRSEVPAEDSGQDFASSIELISERATEIVNELPADTVKGSKGKVLKYYNDEDELRKVLVYPEESAEHLYEEYYYWNGSLFFAYIWDNDGEEMYYYRDGILIRYIDRDGEVHDDVRDNEEYVERGDRYWYNSILRRES